MKMRKIFAGMAASAIALSAFAMSASALDTAGNAGIAFQTNNTWNFRNPYGTDAAATSPAGVEFPDKWVGVQGGGYGTDTSVDCGDIVLQYDGTYTVSIATSGTIKEQNPNSPDGWFANEEKTLTREGAPWSMLYNYETPATDESASDSAAEITQEEYIASLQPATQTDKFNMLLVTTDIPCEYNDDDQPVVNDEVIKVTDLSVDMCGTAYTADTVYFKSDSDYLTICLINTYGESSIDAAALPTSDGTITATFTIEGLGKDPNAGDDSSTADSTTSSTTSGSSNGGTTSNNTNKNNGGTSTTSKATTTSTTNSVTSDATANADSGAPAGIALALAAVAGAAIVVTRKK